MTKDDAFATAGSCQGFRALPRIVRGKDAPQARTRFRPCNLEGVVVASTLEAQAQARPRQAQ
jgi:hypothetical protein